MTSRKLIIFGTGEIATMARYYFDQDSDFSPEAFTVDDEYVEEDTLEGLPVVAFSEVASRFPASEYMAHVGLSYQGLNRLREQKYMQVKSAGYRLASYLCSRLATWPDVVIGDNCMILENQTLQPKTVIGDNVMLWSGNHIGHGTRIRDHAYLASHVVVSGHCDIGERCFIGVNATIKDFTTIGPDCFVGMDASVTRDLMAGSVVRSPRSTIIDGDDPKAGKLINAYFRR